MCAWWRWVPAGVLAAAVGLGGCTEQTAVQAGDCGTCHVYATCGKNGAGAPLCICKAGFTGDGKTSCVDEKVDPSACGGCSADAKCVNRGGTPRCLCNHGFWGSGKICTESSDCADHNGACHLFANCDMTTSISCSCENGFVGDGYECVPPDSSYVRLSGEMHVCVLGANDTCVENYAWEMSVPLTLTGDTYKGTATADIFEISGAIAFQDVVTGEHTLEVSATTYNVTRTKAFHFCTNPDDLQSPDEIPAELLPLEVFGKNAQWYFAGPAGKDYSLSGKFTAVFHKL